LFDPTLEASSSLAEEIVGDTMSSSRGGASRSEEEPPFIMLLELSMNYDEAEKLCGSISSPVVRAL
jgi:hypothetical protein